MILARWRTVYGCDCDGVSHTLTDHRDGAPETGIRRHLDVIGRVTGSRPRTCPWRAYYHPLVREVMQLAWSIEKGNLAPVLGDDPPALLVDALGHYEMALQATVHEDSRLAREKAKQERESAKARRGG